MPGFGKIKKNFRVWSSNGVYSVFVVGFVTQLCSPSNVCTSGAWTHVMCIITQNPF